MKTPVACKGEHALQYTCPPLEADIVGHLTHCLAIKVSRSRYAPAYHSCRAIALPRSQSPFILYVWFSTHCLVTTVPQACVGDYGP
ncbi:hypothetical protein [Xenorhabdus ishibashii]|uniref:hypothetical protein n=1 Tax=Xenorhabdus ishibashii TaxID=1034471 RepID=UPI001145C0D9|nr:hypothetical protein [Xenorhabdus ishibashii]